MYNMTFNRLFDTFSRQSGTTGIIGMISCMISEIVLVQRTAFRFAHPDARPFVYL